MTVARNVAFGLEMRGVPRDEVRRRVSEAIGLVHLSGREGAMPDDLSGGQQQRVALARAIVNRPKVLLLDEPLAALDLRLREAMQVELKQLKAKLGITFVHVTHDQEEALAMSDRLAVMDAGRVVQVGTPQEVYERPRTRFVAAFLGDANVLDETVVDAGHVRLPDGSVARSDVFAWCRGYEERIRAVGGLDLQILGIGRTGHIGFNEPGSTRESRTRLVTLDGLTRRDAARDFLGEANVPRHAITMGVGTILDARSIVLLAWGEAKAAIVAQAVEHPPTDALPASFLQGHPRARFLIDRAAASALTRVRYPWLVGSIEWTPSRVRQSVVWLSQHVGKPVLKLLDEDYSEHGMADLLTERGPAYGLNIDVFNELQHTITGWPGGKPNADDSHRPERASPHPKRVVVFSPEPSHAVLGMGGTLRRLVDQGHDVTVICQTSGSLALPDEEALLAVDLVGELSTAFELGGGPAAGDQLGAVAFATWVGPAGADGRGPRNMGPKKGRGWPRGQPRRSGPVVHGTTGH
jgi:hypothetical protein